MFIPTTAILLAAVAFNAASTVAIAVPTGDRTTTSTSTATQTQSKPEATPHVHHHQHWKALQEAAKGKSVLVTTFGKNNLPNGAHNITSEQQWHATLKTVHDGPIVIQPLGAAPIAAEVKFVNGTEHAHTIEGTKTPSGTPPAASLVSLASAYATKATPTANSKPTGTVTATTTSPVATPAAKGPRDIEEDLEAREYFFDDVYAREFYDDEDILAREFEDDMEARDYEDAEFYGREYESMEDLE